VQEVLSDVGEKTNCQKQKRNEESHNLPNFWLKTFRARQAKCYIPQLGKVIAETSLARQCTQISSRSVICHSLAKQSKPYQNFPKPEKLINAPGSLVKLAKQ
jgi:hypothetical protein